MKPGHTHARTRRGRLSAAFAALLCFGLLFVSTASADYEQVGNFAQSEAPCETSGGITSSPRNTMTATRTA